MKTQIDPIRIDHTGIYLGDKAIPGVIRWTARHEPDRGVFEVQLTLVTSACHVNLDAAPRPGPGWPAARLLAPAIRHAAAAPGQHQRAVPRPGCAAQPCRPAEALRRDQDPRRHDALGERGAGCLPGAERPAAQGPGRRHASPRAHCRGLLCQPAQRPDPAGEPQPRTRIPGGRAILKQAAKLLRSQLDAALEDLAKSPAAPADAAEPAGGAK